MSRILYTDHAFDIFILNIVQDVFFKVKKILPQMNVPVKNEGELPIGAVLGEF